MSNFREHLEEKLKDPEFKMYWDILVLEEKLECLERENKIKKATKEKIIKNENK
jgi:hypothetical protein